MPLSFLEIIGMSLRKTPVAKVRKALAMCERAGIEISAQNLETHHLCGRDPVELADVLVTAKSLGVETSFQEISAVILAGHKPLELILEASKEKVVRFDTFSPKREEKIRGFTRDGREVSAAITVVYQLSPSQLAFSFAFRHIHERLGAAVSAYINTAPDVRTLQMKKSEQEAELKLIALDLIPGFKSASIEYR